MGRAKRFKLGVRNYKQKPVSNDFIIAAEKVKRFLQEEENSKNGRKAEEVTFAYVTKYIYEQYLRGKRI